MAAASLPGVAAAQTTAVAGAPVVDVETAWSRELITAVQPPRPIGGTHVYRKVRDRAGDDAARAHWREPRRIDHRDRA